MKTIKDLIKAIPLVRRLYKLVKGRASERALRGRGARDIFAEIYEKNAWMGSESVSGTGSDLYQTRQIIQELPAILHEMGIRSILDIPCGDYHWMKKIPLDGIAYTGADIVPALVQKNSSAYSAAGRAFMVKDLVTDEIPRVDLIFCRDCLVHLSNKDIACAMRNMCKSDSRYVMTTTFTSRSVNDDILTGQWRPLNLELPPFSFPPPEKVIKEGCDEFGGEFSDKTLGLWPIEALRGLPFVLVQPQPRSPGN